MLNTHRYYGLSISEGIHIPAEQRQTYILYVQQQKRCDLHVLVIHVTVHVQQPLNQTSFFNNNSRQVFFIMIRMINRKFTSCATCIYICVNVHCTSSQRVSLLIMHTQAHRIDRFFCRYMYEWDYGARHVAFPITACVRMQ